MNNREHRKQICISPGHSALAGHFPGNPVVPGVVILDRVRQCMAAWKGLTVNASKLKSVKFLSPVLMQGATVCFIDVLLKEKNTMDDSSTAEIKKIEFRCLHDDELIMQGLWVCQANRAQ